MALELEQVEQLEFLDTDTPAEVEAEGMKELEGGEGTANETDAATDSDTTEEWPNEIVETVEPKTAVSTSIATTTTATPTPDNTAIDDLLSQISNAELRCKRAEWVVIERKEALKEAKEEFDGCVAELRKIAAQARNDSQRPLFGVAVTAATTSTASTPIATDVAPDAGAITSDAGLLEEDATSSTTTAVDTTAWKSTSIDELDDLTPATIENLRKGDVATLGELSDLIERCNGGSSNHWPKGIGKKKQEQIIASLLLWKENNGELGTQDTSEVPVTMPDWDSLSVDECKVYLEGRRALLKGKTCEGLEALYPEHHPQHDLFEEGKEDFTNDDLLINCPYAPTIGGDWEAVDAWVAGWLWGDRQLDGNGADAAG